MDHRTLHHSTPGWVESGSYFHIRIRAEAGAKADLTKDAVANSLLKSVLKYSEMKKWHHYLFLVMPDHIHALLSFPRDASMSKTVGAWKQFHARQSGISWQRNYFDHRIRDDVELFDKSQYIRRNPLVAGLCEDSDEWPWVIGVE